MNKKKTPEKPENKTKTALLLIDVISDFEFEDGEKLFEYALPMARKIDNLKKNARRAGIPIIYINDNFGKWRDDFNKTLEHCLQDTVRGSEIVRLLKPEEEDFFVLKPKHSAFYSTTLELLLAELDIKRLVITGVATDICVLFTANDAYMRGYEIFVPSDCVAAVDPDENVHALEYIERVLKADTRKSNQIKFNELSETAKAGS